MARAHAGLAARAFVQIDREGVLLSRGRLGEGNQVFVITRLRGKLRPALFLGKAFDRRQRLLLGNQAVDEGFLPGNEFVELALEDMISLSSKKRLTPSSSQKPAW